MAKEQTFSLGPLTLKVSETGTIYLYDSYRTSGKPNAIISPTQLPTVVEACGAAMNANIAYQAAKAYK